jgi:hypothetical protein
VNHPRAVFENLPVNHVPRIAIVSGGQTGADRAALDFAIENGLPHAGWCPRGRLAEDGPIRWQYRLQETPSRKYSQRTEWNVRDSDATVLFTIAPQVVGGTALALEFARRLGKPALHLHRDENDGSFDVAQAAARTLQQFLDTHQVGRLNVAGPRASQEPEIGEFVRRVLHHALLFLRPDLSCS